MVVIVLAQIATNISIDVSSLAPDSMHGQQKKKSVMGQFVFCEPILNALNSLLCSIDTELKTSKWWWWLADIQANKI